MKWWETLWKQDVEKDTQEPDPAEVTIDNAYKTRLDMVSYHSWN